MTTMWCLAWWWLWLSLITTLVTSQGPCPTDANIHGFTSITAINNAMMVDLNSIQSGGSPKSSYLFTLCPKTTIVTTVAALTPVLSGAQFVCGAQGALSDACILQGGGANNQVTIANSKVVGYSLHNITFQGITFMASTTQSSILAGAGSGTTAYFINCKWEGFTTNSAMTLLFANGNNNKAMTVVVTGGIVEKGAATTIFNNTNGTLEINGLTVSGSNGQTAIVTSSGGSTTLANANFTSNNYVTLVLTTGKGSSLRAENVEVTSSGSLLQQVFYAQGVGAVMNLTGVSIRDNSLASTFWDGFTFAQGAQGQVVQSNMQGNSGVEFGVNVHNDSTATVQGSTFENNIASAGGLSSVLYALNSSKLYVRDDNVTGNSGFSTYGFTGYQSFTEYDNTTFEGGSVVIAVFIDQDSKFSSNDVFFINVQSQACPPPNQREFIEDVGSHCFYRGPGKCTGVCGVRKNNTFAPTHAASKPPVLPPIVSPTSKPVVPTKAPVPVPPTSPHARPTTSPHAAPSTSPHPPPSTSPHTPTAARPTLSPVRPSLSLAPFAPMATMFPSFFQSGVISFVPTVNKVKKSKKGKAPSKKAGGKKGNPGKKGKSSKKGKKSPKTAPLAVPAPLALPTPQSSQGRTSSSPSSSYNLSPVSSIQPSLSPISRPTLPSSSSAASISPSTALSVLPSGVQGKASVLPIASPPSSPSLPPALIEPPHLQKKKKEDVKAGAKLLKTDKISAVVGQKQLNQGVAKNVFQRETPESSRRRSARGL